MNCSEMLGESGKSFGFVSFSDSEEPNYVPSAPAQISCAKAELAAMRPSRTIATPKVFISALPAHRRSFSH